MSQRVAAHCWFDPRNGEYFGNWRDGDVGDPLRKAAEKKLRAKGMIPKFAYAEPPEEAWVDRSAAIASQMLQLPKFEKYEAEKHHGGRGIRHLKWMLIELANKRVGSATKACRWLGYAQCLAVSNGLATLDECKLYNQQVEV